MKKLKLTAIFAGGFVIGTIATGWWYSRVLSTQISAKEIDFAFQAAEKAEWLAQLRLNQPEIAIKQLEKSMDIQVFTIAQWEHVNALKSEIRERRDRFLVPVKVYHESYPPSNEETSVVSALLAQVPGRDTKSHCKSGVCRLDDLRRASLTPLRTRLQIETMPCGFSGHRGYSTSSIPIIIVPLLPPSLIAYSPCHPSDSVSQTWTHKS